MDIVLASYFPYKHLNLISVVRLIKWFYLVLFTIWKYVIRKKKDLIQTFLCKFNKPRSSKSFFRAYVTVYKPNQINIKYLMSIITNNNC